MDNMIFVNKYDKLLPKLSAALPELAELIRLDAQCVLVSLPRGEKRKEVVQACRECLGEAERTLVQPVISYRESADRIEIALPEIKRFFPKNKAQ